MAEKTVWVKYIDSALAARNGCNFMEMSLHLALQYKEKGLVVIKDLPPELDTPKQIIPQKEEIDETLERIAWISNNYIEAIIQKTGKQLGFGIDQLFGSNFNNQKLLKAKLLIVESNLKGYMANQLADLRHIQFELRKPFVFRVVSYDNSEFFLQNLIHAKCNIFVSQQVFDYTCEMHEDLIEEWLLEDKGDFFSFWRKIDSILNPKPEGIEVLYADEPEEEIVPVEVKVEKKKGKRR